jgi:hypothetical protein
MRRIQSFLGGKTNLTLYGIVYSIAARHGTEPALSSFASTRRSAKLYFDTLIHQIEKSNTPKPISSITQMNIIFLPHGPGSRSAS